MSLPQPIVDAFTGNYLYHLDNFNDPSNIYSLGEETNYPNFFFAEKKTDLGDGSRSSGKGFHMYKGVADFISFFLYIP